VILPAGAFWPAYVWTYSQRQIITTAGSVSFVIG